MNQKEYNNTKQAILKQYGVPEYDLFEPVNESAKKLKELRKLYAKSRQDLKKAAEIALAVKHLAPLALKPVVIPEEIVRPEWLVAFSKEGLQVVQQWLMNTRQGATAISKILKMTPAFVKQVLQSEAFMILNGQLRKAHKEMMPLESWIRLRECLDSDNHSVKYNAAKLSLMDSGDIAPMQEDAGSKDKVFDPDTEARLRELGNKLRKLEGD